MLAIFWRDKHGNTVENLLVNHAEEKVTHNEFREWLEHRDTKDLDLFCVSATGDERALIVDMFSGIPLNKFAWHLQWFGDDAKFIAHNIDMDRLNY